MTPYKHRATAWDEFKRLRFPLFMAAVSLTALALIFWRPGAW